MSSYSEGKWLNKNMKNKGFTILELLIVIAIIGILAAIILASLNTARQKSRDARRIEDIKQIQNALALYFESQATNSYPGGQEGTTFDNALAPTYIPVVPDDPSGGDYQYKGLKIGNTGISNCVQSDPACTYYHLGANLEGDEGTGATNPILAKDADYNSRAVNSNGFVGLSPACTDTGPQTIDGCYDVTPF